MKCSYNVLIPVEATEPVAPWLGGKRHLSKRICAVLAATDHQAYVEPFVGMGGVFLRRRLRTSVEVVNDINSDLVNLYRVIQRHPQALFRELKWRPAMRVEFERLKETRDEDLTDIERAARFLYLQTLSFSGKVAGRSFGVSPTREFNFDLARIEPRIERLRQRLQTVVIENLDWMDCISRYDRPGTLFYLDPPYWGGEGDYGSGIFQRGDFQRMADRLRAIEGRFVMSINDRPEIRAIFEWAEIEAVETTYSVGNVDRREAARELLIGKGVILAHAEPEQRLI